MYAYIWLPHVKSWLIGKDYCCEGLGAGGEGDDRGWDGWMASLTQWTWVWVNSRNWWWTGRPGVLRFMGSQRVGQDWVTELNRTECNICASLVALQCRRPWFNSWVGKIPWRRVRLTHSSILAWKILMDRGAWQATVHGITKSQTQLSD